MHRNKRKSFLGDFARRLIIHGKEILVQFFSCRDWVEKKIAIISESDFLDGSSRNGLVGQHQIRLSLSECFYKVYGINIRLAHVKSAIGFIGISPRIT